MVINDSNNTVSRSVLPHYFKPSYVAHLVSLNILTRLDYENDLLWHEKIMTIITTYGLERIINLSHYVSLPILP